MTDQERIEIQKLIQQEVVPATGCTEPGAVALCVAKTCETLGCEPEKITLRLSKNVFKNAMGVGIPGTGMIGLPIAVAMAVTAGRSERSLEILTISPEEVIAAKQWLANHSSCICIGVEENCDKLYIECCCEAAGKKAKAVIAKRHTNFIYISKDDSVILDQKTGVDIEADTNAACDTPKLSVARIYEYATTAPISELQFINDTVVLNRAAADEGVKGMGLHTGQILMGHANGDIVHQVVARTVAASDARMEGCTKPIYSNSGSGNQGICCTLPVYEFGKRNGNSDEEITRALILSHLMSIYIKRGIGRLSALCGLVNASMGVSAGLVFLQGGNIEQIGYALKNMINTLAGMVCDGAKPSCALKMATGVYSAFVSSRLALEDRVVDETDGLSEKDVDRSVSNLGRLGHDGMDQTDNMILDIMTHKECTCRND
ncbi:MAG: L-serine ammonia-lyase, iron-sulfur-dependent, subunit alpha [Bacteroidales bacterium]|nr:L-serine ammonia-lyase, iron-sulfur-dependent, subunit alpha [Bacteroidales bacterium]